MVMQQGYLPLKKAIGLFVFNLSLDDEINILVSKTLLPAKNILQTVAVAVLQIALYQLSN